MRRIILFLLYITATTQVAAVNRTVYFEHLKVEDGLTQNTVTAILQDRKGFMWFGTKDGLNRYDGYQFRTFRNDPADSTSLGNNCIHSLYEDKRGDLWVGTDTGLYLYDIPTGKLQNTRLDYSNGYSLSSNAVYSLYKDREGGIWVGTYFGGINYLSPDHDYFKKYIPSNDPKSLSGNAVREFQEDEKGNFWIGTEDNGLNYFDLHAEGGNFYRLHPGKQRPFLPQHPRTAARR